MSSKSLYEIGADLLALESAILEMEGDVSDAETERMIDAWFAEIETDRDKKLDDYAALIRTLEARAKMRKEEAVRLTALAKPDENLAKRLKKRLQFFFENVAQKDKIDTPRFRFSLVNNGGVQPVILDTDVAAHPEELPEGYRRVVFEPDLVKIREALENGEKLDFARLGTRGKSLRIK